MYISEKYVLDEIPLLGYRPKISHSGEELVILSHGFKSHPKFMEFLENNIALAGYKTYSLGIFTAATKWEWVVDTAMNQLKKINFGEDAEAVHFVGHSAGGLILKFVTNEYKFENAGKFVSMGT